METFPIESDAVPSGYNGWLVFLDEFTSAPKAVQAAAYRLVLDRQVGPYSLHKKVAIVCAGNLDTDNAIVEEMSTAMQSRLIHMEMVVDHNLWLDWATSNAVDHRIVSYIRLKPDNIYTFKPDHTDHTYGSPRTWEFANRLVKDLPVTREDLPLLAGTLGEGLANEFITFCQIYRDLPTIQQIVANPSGTPVPQEPSTLFALSGSMGTHATEDTIDALITYAYRLPIEFQIIALRDAIRRNEDLKKTKAVREWIVRNANELY